MYLEIPCFVHTCWKQHNARITTNTFGIGPSCAEFIFLLIIIANINRTIYIARQSNEEENVITGARSVSMIRALCQY